MKTVAQTVIEADRFYTIAAKGGSVIQAVEKATNGGDIRLGKYEHKPEQEWSFVREGDGVYRIRNRASGKLLDLTMSGTVRLRSSWAGGKCVDTSMGLTPLAGLPMGTRAGDLDAGILQYLMNKYDMNIDTMLDILNKKSGVQGVSGVSSDFRDLDAAAEKGNEAAQLALDKFAYEVRKYIGAYAAALGGVDCIVFTAGVGENSGSMRASICDGLEYLGVKLDPEKNKLRGEEVVISTSDSKVTVWVIPTNEELMIAQDTAALTR